MEAETPSNCFDPEFQFTLTVNLGSVDVYYQDFYGISTCMAPFLYKKNTLTSFLPKY